MQIRRRLGWQFALALSSIILFIEILMLAGSYFSEKNRLLEIRQGLHQDIEQTLGKDYHELHPNFLSDQDIEERMSNYVVNVGLLVLVVVLSTVAGALLVFHLLAGRHIYQIARLNLQTGSQGLKYYPTDQIPDNELGTVIRSRNAMLKNLESYQNQLSSSLDQAQESLVHAAKLTSLGELSASIAHDIRGPLSVVYGATDLIGHDVKNDSIDAKKINERLDKIRRGSDKIKQLVQGMNQMARKEIEMRPNQSVRELVRQSILFQEHKINEYGINVDLVNVEGQTIWGDFGSLEQVLMNLISNACDAMEHASKKELRIEVSESDRCVAIKVSDTGLGIPAANRENVFKSFFTTKSSGKGTGLGLSIVKQIVESHHGTIDVDSEEGVGTSFVIELPRNPPAKNVRAA